MSLLLGRILYFFFFTLSSSVIWLVPSSTMSNPVPSGSSSSSSSSSHYPHTNHNRHHHPKLHEREQKWINPCRIPSTIPQFTDGNEFTQQQPEADIYHNIIVQTKKAERQALDFVDDFYKENFGGDRNKDKFERVTYDFLGDVMDMVTLGEKEEHFLTLEVEDTIRNTYDFLQRFAVGLEAIVLDQACYGGSFYHHFNEAEFQLKYVLCELQIAMLEKNIPFNDITRDIMKTEYRDLTNKTTRDMRDWTIFRDYIRTLEYVRRAFDHFHRQATK